MGGYRFYLEAYGCSASVAGSERIAGLLRWGAFTPIGRPEDADLSVIVTCTVKTATSHRMIERLRALTSLKRPLLVAGCMPKTERHLVEKWSPSASLICPDSVDTALEAATAALKGEKYVNLERSHTSEPLLPRMRRNLAVGIVEIASGCLGYCSFCQVKVARGWLRSREPEEIFCEVRQALAEGCREIWLTSQDNGCYGLDIGSSLPELLKAVCQVQGVFKVRVGMSNPQYARGMVDELLEAYRDEKIFKFLHLPVQSGSGRVLASMNRGHSVEDFTYLAKRFRDEFPLSTLSTDIIVGFPTETEEDFQKTLSIIREIRPDTVNISRFGARPGTAAEKLTPLDPEVVKERSGRLHRLVREVALLRNSRWVGWAGDVIVDEEGGGALIGRNFAYRPVVIRQRIPLGGVVKVRIVGATSACLLGEPI